jgi:hypothetical protein
MRVWVNKTFSSFYQVLVNIRRQDRGGEYHLLCTHHHAAATLLLGAHSAQTEPPLAGGEYVGWCLEFCRANQVEVFWPGKEAWLIAVHADEFEALGVRVLSVASADILQLLHDKARFYAEVPQDIARPPDCIPVRDAEAFERAYAALRQKHRKVCVKPAVSVNGLGFRLIDADRAGVTHLLKGIEYQTPLDELLYGMRRMPEFDTLLVMEHLDGCEWSVDCAAHQGQLLAAVQRQKPLLAGLPQAIDNNPEIAAAVTRLTAHYRLNGLFNIQFRRSESGTPALLEINARPSGGIGMSCLACPELAYIGLHASLNGPDAIRIPAIKTGMLVNSLYQPVEIIA